MNPIANRRDFLAQSAAASFGVWLSAEARSAKAQNTQRPNILWITSEDNGPQMGCYGDEFANTPNLDRLASQSVIFSNAWSTAPVCAPARTAIITGMYPTATGSEHMRSMIELPDGIRMFPQYLRELGYYCTNNVKEDYNLEKPGQVWDDSSRNAHWRNRAEGQPFFAVFNSTISHESQIRRRPYEPRHDPEQVPIPAYHPDHPEVRLDWAQYYDRMTEMDAELGAILDQLQEDGLAEDTVVFYYGDHGPGMPRGKRWLYQSGLHVPMIVHIPEKFRHLAPADYAPGGVSDRLVGFVDLAPTVLSLVGVEPPAHMQGKAFLGEFATPDPEYIHGFRSRMDERYDMSRAVRDQRYLYIRNYMPHLIQGQYLSYMFQTPTTQVWRELYDQGVLEPPKTHFWEPKPPEELYDIETDPDQVNNLAYSPAHRQILDRMRGALRSWILRTRDAGFLPEDEIHSRSEGITPYEMAQDSAKYPMEAIFDAAETASNLQVGSLPRLITFLNHSDSAVRFWGAMGLLMRGEETARGNIETLRKAMEDEAPAARTVAAQALGLYGDAEDRENALDALVDLADVNRHGLYVSLRALNALDALGENAQPALEPIAALPQECPSIHQRNRDYIPRMIERITDVLGSQ